MALFCICVAPKSCVADSTEDEIVQVVEDRLYPSLVTSTKSRDALKRHSGPRKQTESPATLDLQDHDELVEKTPRLYPSLITSTKSREALKRHSGPRKQTESPATLDLQDDDEFAAGQSSMVTFECKAELESMHKKGGVLSHPTKLMQQAVKLDGSGSVVSADREMLIQSFEAFATVLDKLGNVGSHLSGNTKKLRNSKAVASLTDYQEWLVSELPVHASNKYKDYADPSAGVASIWIGWTLEFFVEMLSNLHTGQETVTSINNAYRSTLSKHHNFLMRNAFTLGVKQQMPNRDKLYALLQGDSDREVVAQELFEFVKIGRSIVRYLLQLHEVMTKKMLDERQSAKSK